MYKLYNITKKFILLNLILKYIIDIFFIYSSFKYLLLYMKISKVDY